MVTGNLLDAPQQIIAHGCNCKGAFNAGVAKAIRERWPIVHVNYMNSVRQGNCQLGTCGIVDISLDNSKLVANCFTQIYPGPHASALAIKKCLSDLAVICIAFHFNGIAIPRIGCGIGGLRWEEDIYPIVLDLSNLVDIWVYTL